MKKWVVALVIGVALLLLSTGANVNDSTITCGSEIMGPGDTCEETRGGTTVDTKTYAEMKADDEAAKRTFESWGRWALLGGGAVLTVLGIWGIVVTRRKRAAAGPPQAGMQPGMPPGGHPQVPNGGLNQYAPQGPAVTGPPQPGYAPHGPVQQQPGRAPQGPSGPPPGGFPQGPPGPPSGGFPRQGPPSGPHGYPRQQPPAGYPPQAPAPRPQSYPHDFGPGSGNPE